LLLGAAWLWAAPLHMPDNLPINGGLEGLGREVRNEYRRRIYMSSISSWISMLFWIFFIFAFLGPLFRQRALITQRFKLIQDLQRQRQSRVIVMIHRQEQMAFLGIPLFRYINIEDSEEILRAIRLTPDEMPIDLVLHTPGGLVLASEQIALALCGHKARVSVLIPHYAMSGGTLVALAADEIVMDPHAVIGPVDPQIGQFPAASILQVVERKTINEVDDNTLIMADIARKAQVQVHSLLEKILGDTMEKDAAHELAEILSDGRWTHDYPITVDEGRMLKLPISTEMPPEIYTLMGLYPQPMQRRPSVEYIPLPTERPAPAPRRPASRRE
jgi:ClpP class serine protease